MTVLIMVQSVQFYRAKFIKIKTAMNDGCCVCIGCSFRLCREYSSIVAILNDMEGNHLTNLISVYS